MSEQPSSPSREKTDAERLGELLDAIADTHQRDPTLVRFSKAWAGLFEKANEIAKEVGHAA